MPTLVASRRRALFTPIPAVDIRGGRCVRLVEGDFARETRYGDDPVAMAQRWEHEGAQRIHVVDLDGARDGVRGNAEVIRRLIGAVSVPVQVGGGVRSVETAQALLADGVDRVIAGTVLVESPERAADWVEQIGSERLVVAVDGRGRQVASRGWQTHTDTDVVDLAMRLKGLGVLRVLYTDVARDGHLEGPNVEVTHELATVVGVIGSGGVATQEHLNALREAGAEGAIIGTALYQGKLSLKEVMAAC
jgi:phosphoribosylformimino-5-aminoimidazole carboxamide ribotide isomerase